MDRRYGHQVDDYDKRLSFLFTLKTYFHEKSRTFAYVKIERLMNVMCYNMIFERLYGMIMVKFDGQVVR